jgi:hypothetical protein
MWCYHDCGMLKLTTVAVVDGKDSGFLMNAFIFETDEKVFARPSSRTALCIEALTVSGGTCMC